MTSVSRSIFASALVACLCLAACATSPLGRRQLKLFPDDQMAQMGEQSFVQIKEQIPATGDAKVSAEVVCVAEAITGALTGDAAQTTWEVVVFEDATANAFAVPGGKIGVNTGLLKVATSQDQLAAVIGHEVAHVLAGHSNERISAEYATQSTLSVVAIAADPANPTHGQLLGLLGAGAQVGVLLPYGRSHESESDLMGLDLMAKAGFDPRASVELWRNMAAAGGQQPPEFLSTHPSHDTRIAELEKRIPQALPIYEQARAAGRRPACF
jgi:predicted Zn-dependent protease